MHDVILQGLKDLQKLEVINFGDCLVRSEGASALAKVVSNGIPLLKVSNMLVVIQYYISKQ